MKYFKIAVLILSLFFGSRQGFSDNSNADIKPTKLEQIENEALSSGSVPIRLMENYRLLPFDSEVAQRFDEEMTALLKRLFPDHDLNRFPVHFVLSHDSEPGAFIIPNAQPILIGYSTGMLSFVQSIDELMYVLRHEWTHYELDVQLGTGHNSKGEEFLADTNSLKSLEDAGFDSRQSLAFFRRLKTIPGPKNLMDLLDVHGSINHRISAVEKAVALLDRQLGGLHTTPQPMPQTFEEIGQFAEFTSHFDFFRKEHGYAEADAANKIEILIQYVDQLQFGYFEREKEFLSALRTLKVDPKNKVISSALHKLADRLLVYSTQGENIFEQSKFYKNAKIFYGLVSAKVTGHLDARPLGGLRLIAKTAKEFIEAQGFSKAFESAKRFNEAMTHTKANAKLLRGIKWPQFVLPTARDVKNLGFGEVEVVWNNLAEYAKADPTDEIVIALFRLGIGGVDQRIYDRMTTDTKVDCVTKKIEPLISLTSDYIIEDGIVVGKFSSNRAYQDLMSKLGVIGQVTHKEISPALYSALGDIEELYNEAVAGNKKTLEQLKRLISKLQVAEDLLAMAEPIGLGNLHYSFELYWLINRHSYSQQEYQSVNQEEKITLFARADALIAEFERLVTENPSKYRPMIHDFFLNSLPDLSGKMSSINPFVKFATADAYNLFNEGERLEIILHSDILTEIYKDGDEMITDLSEINLNPLRDALNYQRPATSAALVSAVRNIGQVPYNPRRPNNTTSKRHVIGWLQAVEVYQYIHYPKAKPFNLIDVLTVLSAGAMESIAGQRRSPETTLHEDLMALVARQRVWPKDPGLALKIWKKIEKGDLFASDYKQKFQLLESIVQSIAAESNPNTRYVLAEEILSGTRIQQPELREQTIKTWCDAARDVFGKDNSTESYLRTLTAVVARLRQNVNVNDRIDMIDRLAKRVESQEPLTSVFKDHLIEKSRENLEQTQFGGVVAELMLTVMEKEAHLRHSMVEFLMQPLSDASTRHMAEIAIDAAPALEGTASETRDETMDRVSGELHLFYQNFWAAPFPARVVILDEIILPQGAKNEKTFQEAVDFVSRHLFPEDVKYSKEARELIEAYLKVIPDYQRSLFLSAMMSAAEKSEGAVGDNIGKRLVLLLELMGPAETKLGQVIHSHPKTPADIRQGMGRIKELAAEPTRWDFYDLYNASVPQKLRTKIARVNAVLGAASYYVVFEVQMQNGELCVLAVLRENALERAENGFSMLVALARDLSEKNSSFDTLADMIIQAKNSASVETDTKAGAKQAEIASSIYDGVKIAVDGYNFNFQTASIIEYGKRYRLMRKAPGDHFNDLPESTPAELARKKALAKAYVFFELYQILKGGKFDFDRHGAQMRVEDDQVYLFDFGGMLLEEPSSQDRALLGSTLYEGIEEFIGGGDIAEVFMKELQRQVKEKGLASDYLMKVEKALLALQDFMRYIEPAEIKDIFASVAETGQIHPEVTQGFTARGMEKKGELDLSLFTGACANIFLTR